MKNNYYEDTKEAIMKAKENDLLTEKVKVYLAGQIIFCQIYGLIKWNDVEELLKLAEIDIKKVLGASEIATSGKLLDCVGYPIEFQKGE